jgi:outer membrane lipoprotein SlyB
VQYITEPAPAPVTRTVVRRAPARSVYRASSASSASPASPAQREPRLVRKTRSTKGSVLIIGGSTVGGAGIGAIVGGKKGAVIGGLIGGAAGTVYDRTTRHKNSYE